MGKFGPVCYFSSQNVTINYGYSVMINYQLTYQILPACLSVVQNFSLPDLLSLNHRSVHLGYTFTRQSLLEEL